MSSIGEDDIAFYRRKARRELFHDWHKGEVDQHDPIFSVVHDPGDLLWEEPRVDGVIDRSDAKDPVPGFQAAPGVPCQGCNPVAELDAVLGESLGDPEGACPDVLVIGRVYWTFD